MIKNPGLTLYCSKNRYYVLDNYSSEVPYEIYIGDIITNISSINGREIINLVSSLPYATEKPTEKNITESFSTLSDMLREHFGSYCGMLIIAEYYQNLSDYFTDKEICLQSLQSIFSENNSFLTKCFEGKPYNTIGDSTIEHLFLSLIYSIGQSVVIAHKLLDCLISDSEPDKIISLFTDLFTVQETEVRIVIIAGSFQQLYTFPSMPSVIAFDLYKIIDSNTPIKRCKNCNEFFAPHNRIDTLYCNRLSPQDATKTCQEYGKYMNYLTKTQTDASTKLYKQIYNSLFNRIKRSPDDEALVNALNNFKTNAKQWKADIKTGCATSYEYEQWLKYQKEKLSSTPPTTE